MARIPEQNLLSIGTFPPEGRLLVPVIVKKMGARSLFDAATQYFTPLLAKMEG
jgi:hypothetical protein